MIPSFKFGIHNVPEPVQPLIAAIFGLGNNVQELVALADVDEFVEDPEYPIGKVLVANTKLLDRSKGLRDKLDIALRFATFHLIVIQTDDGDIAKSVFENPNVHLIRHDHDYSSQLMHHLYGLKGTLESFWLRTTVSYIMNCYEQSYSMEVGHPEKLEDFILGVVEEVRAESLHIFFLQIASNGFIPEIGYGNPAIGSVPLGLVNDLFRFDETCLTYMPSSPELQTLKRKLFPNGETDHVLVLTTFKLDGDPGLILYSFAQRFDPGFMWPTCSFASRELFHLLRSKEVRSQYETLKMLTMVQHLESGKRETLWETLSYLQRHFCAEGASLVEKLPTEDGEGYKFEKTYIHRSQKGYEPFEGGKGLADYCISKNKALLIVDSLHNHTPPHINCVQFEPHLISAGLGEKVQIEYVITQKTVEAELCMMYFPLKLGSETVGAVKIGDFDNPWAFDHHQLRALGVFAEPIVSLLQNLGSVVQLISQVEKKDDQRKLVGQAEVLFFYREIALGIFHQVSNHLHNIGSGLLKAEILADSSQGKGPELRQLVEKSRHLARTSMELIHKAQKRGRNLTPISQECQLVESVVRPAIDYAKKLIEGTSIVLEHTLTNRDYTVRLDPDLAKESLINLLNNSIWAVKEHTRTTKKHILVVVREVPEEKAVMIKLEDSGIGIEPDTFANLFTPFFTTRSDGTGLGLYFARRLVEHFGGTVKVTRSSVGKGTTAVVTFPLMEA